MAEQLLTPEQLSEQLQVPLTTLQDWRYHGRGPAYLKLGHLVRYKQIDVDRWLQESRVA